MEEALVVVLVVLLWSGLGAIRIGDLGERGRASCDLEGGGRYCTKPSPSEWRESRTIGYGIGIGIGIAIGIETERQPRSGEPEPEPEPERSDSSQDEIEANRSSRPTKAEKRRLRWQYKPKRNGDDNNNNKKDKEKRQQAVVEREEEDKERDDGWVRFWVTRVESSLLVVRKVEE